MTSCTGGTLLCSRNVKNTGGGKNHLVVAVQDSDVVLKYKPQAHLVCSTKERVYMVESIKYVDEVVVYTSVDDIVTRVDFDILAVGPDQNHEAFQRAFRWCREHGKQVVVLPRTEGISSSSIKKEIKNQ